MSEISQMQNPFGLRTVTPYLIVNDVRRLVDFMVKLFGASQRGEYNYRDDGSVQHAEVLIGDSVIMLGEPIDDFAVTFSMLYVYVDDCDVTYHRALTLGAERVLEPKKYPHGDRYGGVKDSAGNIWWIVTHEGGD